MNEFGTKCPHPKCEEIKPVDDYACRAHFHFLPMEIKKLFLGARFAEEGYMEAMLVAHEKAVAYWDTAKETTEDFWVWVAKQAVHDVFLARILAAKFQGRMTESEVLKHMVKFYQDINKDQADRIYQLTLKQPIFVQTMQGEVPQ